MTEKITWNGQDVEAEEVDIVSASEPWNTYLLEDGTTLRTRMIVTRVMMVRGVQNDQGFPFYVWAKQTISDVRAPESQRQGNVQTEPLEWE